MLFGIWLNNLIVSEIDYFNTNIFLRGTYLYTVFNFSGFLKVKGVTYTNTTNIDGAVIKFRETDGEIIGVNIIKGFHLWNSKMIGDIIYMTGTYENITLSNVDAPIISDDSTGSEKSIVVKLDTTTDIDMNLQFVGSL